MDTKTAGYFFLGIGLIIMVFALIQVVLGFTNIIHPTYFSSKDFAAKPSPTPAPSTLINSSGGLDQSQISQMISSSLLSSINILPVGVLDNALNLSAHFFLMTFIGGFGHKLAMIGVNLIRPIVVKTGEKTLPPSQ